MWLRRHLEERGRRTTHTCCSRGRKKKSERLAHMHDIRNHTWKYISTWTIICICIQNYRLQSLFLSMFPICTRHIHKCTNYFTEWKVDVQINIRRSFNVTSYKDTKTLYWIPGRIVLWYHEKWFNCSFWFKQISRDKNYVRKQHFQPWFIVQNSGSLLRIKMACQFISWNRFSWL